MLYGRHLAVWGHENEPGQTGPVDLIVFRGLTTRAVGQECVSPRHAPATFSVADDLVGSLVERDANDGEALTLEFVIGFL